MNQKITKTLWVFAICCGQIVDRSSYSTPFKPISRIINSVFRLGLAVVALLSMCEASFAAQWFMFFHASDDKTYVLFDKESVIKERGNVTLWINVFKRPSEGKSTRPTKNTLMHTTVDCGRRMIATNSLITYDERRNVLERQESSGRLHLVIPDTIGEGVANAVCEQNFPSESKPSKYLPVDSDTYQDAEISFLLRDAFKRANTRNSPSAVN